MWNGVSIVFTRVTGLRTPIVRLHADPYLFFAKVVGNEISDLFRTRGLQKGKGAVGGSDCVSSSYSSYSVLARLLLKNMLKLKLV